MASIGEIWLVDFAEPFPGEPAHHRPAVVLGPPPGFGGDFPFVIVCPLTTTRRGLSIHVEVEAAESNGLQKTSYVQCERIRSVNRRRLTHRLGEIDRRTGDDVRDVVATLLGW